MKNLQRPMRHVRSMLLAVAWLLAVAAPLQAASRFAPPRWLEVTAIEEAALADDQGKLHGMPLPFTPYNTARPKIPRRTQVLADRYVYLADEPVAQVLIYLLGQPALTAEAKLDLSLVQTDGEAGAVVEQVTVGPLASPKLAVLVRLEGLPAGGYEVRAAMRDLPGAIAIPSAAFEISGERHETMPFPEQGVELVMHELTGAAVAPEASHLIRTALPLPRGASDDPDAFVLLENGRPAVADFHPRATWHADGSDLKWLGMNFIARYDAGTPRAYRVVPRQSVEGGSVPAVADAAALRTEVSDAWIEIDTGAIAFRVNRQRFAGLENLRLSGGQPLASEGVGGPFLVDERNVAYTAARDPYVQVHVEEQGATQATIHATGWYRSERNERACIFHTRITAVAGQPYVDITHSTIITYDTNEKKLRELGFAVPVTGGGGWQIGIDGESHQGQLAAAEKGKPRPSAYVHQDRFDHVRLMAAEQGQEQVLAEGRHADGWASLGTPAGMLTVGVRNIWQQFPKELELTPDALYVHFWPRHGHEDAFPDEEALAIDQIHKARYAHQGDLLDLKLPQKYFDTLQSYGNILEQQDINGLVANGRGLAITNTFTLYLQPPVDGGQAATLAPALGHVARMQQDPHGIPDPVYIGLTEVEGRFAGYQPETFPNWEQVLTEDYHGYTMSVEILKDYGMWIWPDVHNNWNPEDKTLQLHRWWNNSHYQNVWEANFLYLRSGKAWIKDWARENTRHFQDVGTVNYHDPQDPKLGKLTGSNYHTKGFLPWGSAREHERCSDDYVEVGAHFVNPDAHIIRWLVFGEHRGLELARAWARAFGDAALPPERSREACTTLGEMISYYRTTWDPQAILYIRDLADDMHSRPWTEIPAHPGHTLFHDRWVQRYWWLTRDPRTPAAVLEWFTPDHRSVTRYPQMCALAWRLTGDVAYLEAAFPALAEPPIEVYRNPADPLHYYGARRYFWPSHSSGQMMPYYMQALLDAGIDPATVEQSPPTAIQADVNLEKDRRINPFQVDRASQGNPVEGYLHLREMRGAVELTFLPHSYPHLGAAQPVSHITVHDGSGGLVLDTTILKGSQRETASVTLEPGKGPWRIVRRGLSYMQWTGGAAGAVLRPAPESAP